MRRVRDLLMEALHQARFADARFAREQYDLTFATPYPGAYTVSVRFAEAAYTVSAHAGDHVTLRANGTYAIQ